jgi:hypothetical protein
MAMPSTFRKTEVVAVQHVMEESEKPLTPDGVEIRRPRQKIRYTGKPLQGINYRAGITYRADKRRFP